MNFDWHTVIIPNYTPVILILGFLLYIFTYHTINTFSNITDLESIKQPKLVLRLQMYLNYIYFALLVIFWHLFFYDIAYSILIFVIYFVLFMFITSDGLYGRYDMHHIFKMIYAKIRRKPFIQASQMDEKEFGMLDNKTVYILSLIFLFINVYCTYNILKNFESFFW